ncbi:MAG: DUF1289 domain-containing protein [Colwellia sp.]|nr:DUF1289 domain-containing protein [Colwellia sp.]
MQLDFFDVPSPCVGVCQSNEKGYCLGCLRSRDERQKWQEFDNDKKQKVIKLCTQRKKRQQNKANKRLIESQEQVEIDQEEFPFQPSLLEPQSKTTAEHSNNLDFSDFEL